MSTGTNPKQGEQQVQPALTPARKAPPDTKQPGFLSSVSGARIAEPARFGHRDRATSSPVDERARAGVTSLRELQPHERGGPAAVHTLHPAPHLDAGASAPQAPSHEGRGHPASDPQLQRERDRLVHAVETLQLQAQRLAEQARADTIEIAFQIAQKILETELHTSPEPLFALVRSALRQAGEARWVKLRLNPADAELVRSPKGEGAVAGLTVARIEIVTDGSLARGDVVIDTDFGNVDGRLASRFGELRRALATDAA